MQRMIGLVLVLSAALVGVLWWILSGAQSKLQDRTDLVTDPTKARAKGDRSETVAWPRRESFEVLRLSWPENDPRRDLGGETILSLRGNGVLFHRSLDRCTFQRTLISETSRMRILDVVREQIAGKAEPKADGIRLSFDEGTGKPQSASIEATTLKALLELIAGTTSPWIPEKFQLWVAKTGAPAGKSLAAWPENYPRFPTPEVCSSPDGWKSEGPVELRKKVFQSLTSGDPLLFQGVAYALTRLAITWP